MQGKEKMERKKEGRREQRILITTAMAVCNKKESLLRLEKCAESISEETGLA